MRLLNFLVICALITAASIVYKIKFESTLQAERVAKLRNELRNESNAIAALRAEWSMLATPHRILRLAERHLSLKPIQPTQFDALNRLPDRPPATPPAPSADPIGAIIAPQGSQAAGHMPGRVGG